MISISCDNLCLAFGTDVVFEKVSFALNEGDKLGIVGVNGAGKSSLLKMITGEYQPSDADGHVYISKDYAVAILEQHPDFSGDDTVISVMDGVFSSLIRAEEELEKLNLLVEGGDIHAATQYSEKYEKFTRDGGLTFRGKCRGMLRRFGFSEDMWNMRTASLSGGQKTRLALARLLLSEPDIMLLDEPTNHLDTDTLFWLEGFLSNYKKTVITVSHDRYFLDRICTHILEIENTHATLYNGNYSAYAEKKKTDREIAERHYKNQQKEIARIEAYIEQQRRWNRERNIIAAESREKQLAKMEKVDKPENLPDSVKISFHIDAESGNDVLEIRRLAKSFGKNHLFADVNFLVKKHDRVFIDGHNGCGKSTLLKIIAGKLTQDSGAVELGYNVSMGYYDQENQNLGEHSGTNATVLDELWDTYPNKTQTEIRNSLAQFLFRGDDVLKPISVLSGGEKARLTLTKLMLAHNNLLVLDEPTNHLDIASREALEDALASYDGTLVAVSHDRYFVEKLSTRMITFDKTTDRDIFTNSAGENPTELFVFNGGYDEFVKYREQYLSPAYSQSDDGVAADAPKNEGKESYLNAKKNQAEKRKEANKLKNAKAESEKIEAELEEIEARLSGDDATDYTVVAELYEKKEALEERLLELYEIIG